MKLSDLKALVEAIEANTLSDNEDPNITFWIPRDQASQPAGEKDASQFIELSLNRGDAIVGPDVVIADHRVAYRVPGVLHRTGDFTIPAHIVPFYE